MSQTIVNLFAVVGFAVALYQIIQWTYSWARPSKDKSLTLLLASQVIYRGNPQILLPSSIALREDFNVLYGGLKVECLHVLQIVIWNSGDVPLSQKDIVASDPLKIEFNHNNRILDGELDLRCSESTQFAVEKTTDHSISFCFQHLLPNEGATINVFTEFDPLKMRLSGHLYGEEPKKCFRIHETNTFRNFGRALSPQIGPIFHIICIAIIFSLGAVAIISSIIEAQNLLKIEGTVIEIVFSAGWIILVGVFLYIVIVLYSYAYILFRGNRRIPIKFLDDPLNPHVATLPEVWFGRLHAWRRSARG